MDHGNGDNHVNEYSECRDATKQSDDQSQAATKLCDDRQEAEEWWNVSGTLGPV